MATHSSTLAWRIPGMGEPGGLPSMGSHRVRHNWSNLAAAADYTPIWGRWDFFSKRNFQDYKSICRYQSSLTPKASEKWCSVCSFHYFCFLMMETYNEMCREWFLCWPWLVSLFLACFQSQTTLCLLLVSSSLLLCPANHLTCIRLASLKVF